MLKVQVDLTQHMPIGRGFAGDVAAAACRFECTLTLEKNGIILNPKSMIGLLSQSVPKDGVMTLIADGKDEQQAIDTLLTILAGLSPDTDCASRRG